MKRESQALDKQQLKQQLRQQLKDQQKQERQRTARATAEALTKAAKASKATKASKGKAQAVISFPAAMLGVSTWQVAWSCVCLELCCICWI